MLNLGSNYVLFISIVFASWAKIGHCDISKLLGSCEPVLLFMQSQPTLIRCNVYLEYRNQTINVDFSVVAGPGSVNAGKAIQVLSKQVVGPQQNRDGRWFLTLEATIQATFREDPVVFTYFYTYNGKDGKPYQATFPAINLEMLPATYLKEQTGCIYLLTPICTMSCTFETKRTLKAEAGSCLWHYRPSADAPAIVIESSKPDCKRINALQDKTSLYLADWGFHAGEYICRAKYKTLGFITLGNHAIPMQIDASSRKSDLNGICSSSQECTTYRATCVGTNGTDDNTCQCPEKYPKIHKKKKGGKTFNLACYGEGGPPADGASMLTLGLLPFVTALLAALSINWHC